MRKYLWLFASVCALLEADQQVALIDDSTSTVHVEVVDPFGRPIPKFAIALVSAARTGQQRLLADDKGDIAGIAHGDYSLRVSASGFSTETRLIHVDRQNVWLTVPLQVWPAHSEPDKPVLNGHVSPVATGEKVWAKLVGVYEDLSLEAAISETGAFYFQPNRRGVYVLIIIRGDKVLYLETLLLFRDRSVQISLSDR